MSNSLSSIPSAVSSNPEAADHNIILTVDVAGHISGDVTMPSIDDLIIPAPDMILEPMYEDKQYRPSYCNQDHGDCALCWLVHYHRNCMNTHVSDREVCHD